MAVVQRFPLTVFSISFVNLYIVSLIVAGSETVLINEDISIRANLTAGFVSLLSFIGYLVAESLRHKRWYAEIFTIPCALLYYITLPEDINNDPNFDYMLIHLAIYLALGIAVFIAPAVGAWQRREYQDQHFYHLLCVIVLSMAEAIVVAFCAFAAVASILLSIDLLFDSSNISEDIYLSLWVLLSMFLAPVFFLARFPKDLPASFTINEQFLSVVIRFIALPFIGVYFIILYAYTIKVLANFSEWPEGIVTWLVIGFSVFGLSLIHI